MILLIMKKLKKGRSRTVKDGLPVGMSSAALDRLVSKRSFNAPRARAPTRAFRCFARSRPSSYLNLAVACHIVPVEVSECLTSTFV